MTSTVLQRLGECLSMLPRVDAVCAEKVVLSFLLVSQREGSEREREMRRQGEDGKEKRKEWKGETSEGKEMRKQGRARKEEMKGMEIRNRGRGIRDERVRKGTVRRKEIDGMEKYK